MDSKFFSLLFVVFCLVGFVSAWDICIDAQVPDAPTGLSVSGNVMLSWSEAVDEPDCSDIDYYKIYVDGNFLNTSKSTSYSGGELTDGIYTFGVSAVDKGGNEGGRAIKEVVFPVGSGGNNVVPNGGGGSGGGSSGGSSSSSSSENSSNGSSSDLSGSLSEGDNDYGTTLIDASEESDEGAEEGFFSTITGAVTGAMETTGGIVVSVFILLALGRFVAIRVRKKKK